MKQLASSLAVVIALSSCETTNDASPSQTPNPESRGNPDLGAFSISLAVKDLEASRAFYEKLGFEVIGGNAAQNWQILQNGSHTIGLFQGMFEKNIMTFNPGWTSKQQRLEQFEDVRDIQRALESQGLELETRADESTTGPASLVLVDPDGNRILFDQHVPRPGS